MEIPLSWTAYLAVILGSCAVYYIIVILKYYSKELFRLKSTKKFRVSNPNENNRVINQHHSLTPSSPVKSGQENISSAVHDFSDELKALLLQSAAQQSGKQTLISSVAELLKKYPSLKGSAFQEALSNKIALDCIERCSITLDGQDLISMWQ